MGRRDDVYLYRPTTTVAAEQARHVTASRYAESGPTEKGCHLIALDDSSGGAIGRIWTYHGPRGQTGSWGRAST
jgi:hypothetical protein